MEEGLVGVMRPLAGGLLSREMERELQHQKQSQLNFRLKTLMRKQQNDQHQQSIGLHCTSFLNIGYYHLSTLLCKINVVYHVRRLPVNIVKHR